MIQLAAHLHQDDNGTAHVAITSTDPDQPSGTGPLPCGVLTMTPAAAAELADRIAAGEHSPTTITPEIAAHVLWRYDATGGMEPGSFKRALLDALDRADREHTLRLAAVYPGYASAVTIARYREDGIHTLQGIARWMLVPAAQDGGKHRG